MEDLHESCLTKGKDFYDEALKQAAQGGHGLFPSEDIKNPPACALCNLLYLTLQEV